MSLGLVRIYLANRISFLWAYPAPIDAAADGSAFDAPRSASLSEVRKTHCKGCYKIYVR